MDHGNAITFPVIALQSSAGKFDQAPRWQQKRLHICGFDLREALPTEIRVAGDISAEPHLQACQWFVLAEIRQPSEVQPPSRLSAQGSSPH